MAETLFRILKITVIIGICAIFMVAINLLLGFVTEVVVGGVIGETIALVSMYLPFNASIVFGSILSAGIAITAFLVAKKIFDLTSWGINSI